VDTLIWTLLLVVPYAILTTAGVLLWRRWRSAATGMIALGFAATLLSLASGLFATYKTHAALAELTSAPRAHQDTYFIVAHYHRFPLLTLGLLGAVVRPLNFTVRRSGTPRWVRLVSLPWDSSLGWLSFRSYCGGLPYFIQPWGSTAATS